MPSIRQRFHLSPCSDFRSHFCSVGSSISMNSLLPRCHKCAIHRSGRKLRRGGLPGRSRRLVRRRPVADVVDGDDPDRVLHAVGQPGDGVGRPGDCLLGNVRRCVPTVGGPLPLHLVAGDGGTAVAGWGFLRTRPACRCRPGRRSGSAEHQASLFRLQPPPSPRWSASPRYGRRR